MTANEDDGAKNRGKRAPQSGSGEVTGSGAGAGGGGNAEDFDSDQQAGQGQAPPNEPRPMRNADPRLKPNAQG